LPDIDTTIPRAFEAEVARLFNRGNAELRNGTYPLAIASFTAVLVQDSTVIGALFNRAIASAAAGELPGAIQDYSRLIEANPSIGEAYVNRGVVCLTQGQWTSAIRDFERALELRPQNYLACYDKAVACESAGRTLDAVAAYRAFVASAPVEYYGAAENAARRAIELTLAQADSAVLRLSAEVAYDSACQELSRGRYVDAARGFQHYLDKSPAGPWAADAESWLGECYLALGLADRAERLFEHLRTVYANRKWTGATYRLGVIAMAAGRTDFARSSFQEVIRRSPGSAEAELSSFRLQALE
jgi:tetratricopeptide (TPR) repeat protein